MRKKVFSVILLLIALLVLGGCTQQSIQGDAGRVLNRQSESSDDLNSPKDAPEWI